MKSIRDCNIHPSANVMDYVNMYECVIGENVFIGPFVEIQRGVTIGKNSKISSHTFICEGVTIGENCFIGHGVMFTNDKYDSKVPNKGDYIFRETIIGDNVRIGSNATILPVIVGNSSVIGAGAVVTKDVSSLSTVAGVPAKKINRSSKKQ